MIFSTADLQYMSDQAQRLRIVAEGWRELSVKEKEQWNKTAGENNVSAAKEELSDDRKEAMKDQSLSIIMKEVDRRNSMHIYSY